MNTEITDNNARQPAAGLVCYDGECAFCVGWAQRMERTLVGHGFTLTTLQARERRRLAGRLLPKIETRRQDAGAPGRTPAPVFTEMVLELPDGRELGGADAAMEIARHVWWLWPLWLLSRIPGMMPIYRAVYRHIAANRNCASGNCTVTARNRWLDWLPLPLLLIATLPFRNHLPNWIFMWLFVTAMFAGCKWLTWRRARTTIDQAGLTRTLGYLFAWPGMDAKLFLTGHHATTPKPRDWLFATTRLVAGIALLWLAAHTTFTPNSIANAWLAMFSLTLILHFGAFHLAALAWQRAGVPAKPLMQSPATATSLADFWGVHWNTAFNKLVHDLTFRPLARRAGITWATLGVFAISGVIHELAISFPARGGYGLPFGYFLLQGIGVLMERSRAGRASGLGHGWRGWLFMFCFTAAPAYWLFHPTFVQNVILPMLQTIGAT